MGTLSEIRAALATAASSLPDVTGYDHVPGSINLPAAVVLLGDPFATYDQATGGVHDYTYSILLLVQSAEEDLAQGALDGYAAPTGIGSVKAAVEADPDLGGTCDYATVTTATSLGKHDIAGGSYWGCRFPVTVGVSG